jgi:hypothetical protein
MLTKRIRIVKLNAATGDKMWDKIYDYGVGNDDAFDIKKVASGGTLLSGMWLQNSLRQA